MTNELYHHGIRGQRWGKKNGPPYPLDPEDHSASEKKAKKSGGILHKAGESYKRQARKTHDELENYYLTGKHTLRTRFLKASDPKRFGKMMKVISDEQKEKNAKEVERSEKLLMKVAKTGRRLESIEDEIGKLSDEYSNKSDENEEFENSKEAQNLLDKIDKLQDEYDDLEDEFNDALAEIKSMTSSNNGKRQ